MAPGSSPGDAGYIGTANTAPYTFNWNTATVLYGPHTLYARAYDTSGNAGTSQVISVTVVDAAPPTVSLTAPAAGASVSGSVAVNATASDNVGVEQHHGDAGRGRRRFHG